MKMTVSVDKDAFSKIISEVKQKLVGNLLEGMELACLEVEDEAVDRCPVGSHEGTDTVPLAQSITHKVINEMGLLDGKVVGVVGSNLEHAVYVHEGTGILSRTGRGRTHDLPWSYQDDLGNWHTTSGMSSRPFLEEARDAKMDRVRQILAAHMLED